MLYTKEQGRQWLKKTNDLDLWLHIPADTWKYTHAHKHTKYDQHLQLHTNTWISFGKLYQFISFFLARCTYFHRKEPAPALDNFACCQVHLFSKKMMSNFSSTVLERLAHSSAHFTYHAQIFPLGCSGQIDAHGPASLGVGHGQAIWLQTLYSFSTVPPSPTWFEKKPGL